LQGQCAHLRSILVAQVAVFLQCLVAELERIIRRWSELSWSLSRGFSLQGPPAQIATFHVEDWVPGPVSTAGQETEGIEFSRDGKLMLVANESQETIGVFDEVTGAICETSI